MNMKGFGLPWKSKAKPAGAADQAPATTAAAAPAQKKGGMFAGMWNTSKA